LTRWIRYAAFPQLTNLTSNTDNESECNIRLLYQLGFKSSSIRLKCPGVKSLVDKNLREGIDFFESIDSLLVHLAHNGFGKFLLKDDLVIDEYNLKAFCVYLAENPKVETFITPSVIEPSSNTTRSPFTRRKRLSLNKTEDLEDKVHKKKDNKTPIVNLNTNVAFRISYKKVKSLKKPSTLIDPLSIDGGQDVKHIYETLGKCRFAPSSFSWNRNGGTVSKSDILHYSKNLGRVYFKGFKLRDKYFNVGDFVQNGFSQHKKSKFPDIFRIVAAYQACQTFVGKWNSRSNQLKNKTQIQKRGHPYILIVQMRTQVELQTLPCIHSFKTEKPSKEILLERTIRDNPDHVSVLPVALSDLSIDAKKILVDVGHNAGKDSNSNNFFCYRYVIKSKTKSENRTVRKFNGKELSSDQISLLTFDAKQLIKKYVPDEWWFGFSHQHVNLIHEISEERDVEDSKSGGVHFSYTEYSSDDSDEFDEDSRVQILSTLDEDISPENNDFFLESSDDDMDSTSDELLQSQSLNSSENYGVDQAMQSLTKKNDKDEVLVQLAVSGSIYNGKKYVDEYLENQQKVTNEELLKTTEAIKNLCYDEDLCGIAADMTKSVKDKIWSGKDLASIFHIGNRGNDIILQHDSIFGINDKLEEIRSTLGYDNFRRPQGEVCIRACTTTNDIVFLAPTGHGKSLSFIIPAKFKGGVTLVIEPLKEIINDQIRKISGKGILVEHLLSMEDSGKKGGMHARDRLTQIANEYETELCKNNDKVLILFATPELVEQDGVLQQLERMYKSKKMTRCVFDEFDVSADNHRSVYKGILSKLSKNLPDVPFMFLSATTDQKDLLSFLSDLPRVKTEKPHLFVHDRPISNALSFYVERKEGHEQVSRRIAHILKSYQHEKGCRGKQPKAICYCLTRKNCEDMAKHLDSCGINATAVHAKIDRSAISDTINQFKKGKVQVICATEVLGRGVDIQDIRFVFHTNLPLSMRSYIQQSGRGGRDGKECWCILFFRSQDRHSAERVKRIKPPDGRNTSLCLEGKALRNAIQELEEVMTYCRVAGSYCRYKLLSDQMLSLSKHQFESRVCQGPGLCDGCRTAKNKVVYGLKNKNAMFIHETRKERICLVDVNINFFVIRVLNLLDKVLMKDASGLIEYGKGGANKIISNLAKELVNTKKTYYSKLTLLDKEKWPAVVNFVPGSYEYSLRNDLVRLFLEKKILEKKSHSFHKGNDFDHFRLDLESNKVKIFLNNVRFFESSSFLKLKETEHTFENSEESINYKSQLINNSTPKRKLSVTSDDLEKRKQIKLIEGSPLLKKYPTYECHFFSYPQVGKCWIPQLSFLTQFEIVRLFQEERLSENQLEEIRAYFAGYVGICDGTNRVTLCHKIHEQANTFSLFSKYRKIVEAAKYTKSNVDEGSVSQLFCSGTGLYFSANLSNDRGLQLLPVESANDRRIFRKFGSHRFLHVNIRSNVSKNTVKKFFSENEKLWVCGRHYTYLWAKATKTPQTFILFAERGMGIGKADEIKVDEVRQWCLPLALNIDPPLTIGKELKRFKLNFSKTTASNIIPPNSLRVVDDIEDNFGNIRTDGCGLLSRDALDHIWSGYKATKTAQDQSFQAINNGNRNEDNTTNTYEFSLTDVGMESEIEDEECSEETACEFTSVQGRIGGFKGMWVLDENLGDTGDGIKIICRKSQLKYNLPMKSLIDKTNLHGSVKYDEMYDTFDVCKWDDKLKDGHLSIRHVQILESRGLPMQRFKSIAERSVKRLFSSFDDQRELFFHLGKKRAAALATKKDDTNNEDSFMEQLYSMACVSLDRNEPVFKKNLYSMILSDTKLLREKAKYRCGAYVRIFPDHTSLLDEGEAYLALGDDNQNWLKAAKKATDVIAMRNPAYFQGDLCKLKLVSRNTLYKRSTLSLDIKNAGNYPYKFFEKLRIGLVLNIKGAQCHAHQMSGGDFDGDEAWVCWDKSVVEHICVCPPQPTEHLIAKKSPEESKLSSDATLLDRIQLALHYKYHQSNLGKLSILLDKVLDTCGFESNIACHIGNKLFLQVDHPYYLQKLSDEIESEISGYSEPHWAKRKVSAYSKFYQSTKALGGLWDYMEQQINNITKSKESKQGQKNEFILKIVKEYESKSIKSNKIDEVAKLSHLRNKMKRALNEFRSELDSFQKVEDYKDSQKRNVWFSRKYASYNEQLITSEDGEDSRNLAAAVLYEHCNADSDFPWRVALDRLLRIYSDANTRCKGRGDISKTVDHDNDKAMFSMTSRIKR